MVTYIKVQAIRVDHVVVDNLDLDCGVQVLDQVSQLGTANTIRTVNSQRALNLHTLHDLLEGCCELLIVAIFRRLAVLILRPQGILAAHDVVELGGRHVLEVDEFNVGRGQGRTQNTHQARSRRTSITGEDHAGGIGHVDINLLHKLIVNVGDFVERRIRQLGRVLFPLGLETSSMVSLERDSFSLD